MSLDTLLEAARFIELQERRLLAGKFLHHRRSTSRRAPCLHASDDVECRSLDSSHRRGGGGGEVHVTLTPRRAGDGAKPVLVNRVAISRASSRRRCSEREATPDALDLEYVHAVRDRTLLPIPATASRARPRRTLPRTEHT